ncbi:helix-turn-helix domain-containing protein [Ruminococcaceae bacterium OttesenSCG-928-I18]|nr:helix-turn-helix domain-containing protein [Ruminococcaceae bacterium OttesenSCG-928-I18]
MANRVFQGVLYQMKDVLDRTAGVVDVDGVVVSCTDVARIGEANADLTEYMENASEGFVKDGVSYHVFSSGQGSEFASYVQGDGEPDKRMAAVLALSFQNILQYHDEKFDKSNFIKNVVLENILPGDIFAKARELHFATDVSRVVLLIRVVSGTDISAFEVVNGLFPDKQKDFIFNASETDTVLVKEIKRGIDEKDIEKLAASIVDTLNGEHYIKAVVGIGTPISNIKDLSASFKEAQIALEVGKVFDTEQQIVSYNHLGIARLIYQLPTTLCEMFLKEVFNQGSIDSLDDETLFTIQRFFENNLNVSETSRGLFVHRNTLVYRLEKIKKLTGLDLREFDDAIVFKVALMVKKYLNSNTAKY